MTEGTMGRRERKKAATRQALADAAMELFLQRGFDQVSVREIADAADVSTTTLFKHFPSKEALVFDEAVDHEAELVAAVRDRVPGESIPAALRRYVLQAVERVSSDPRWESFVALSESSNALRSYADRMWMRHRAALAAAIAEQAGCADGDPKCAALAHFALQTRALARGPRSGENIAAAFDLLENGWRTG
ncbi:TetR/AcrR family transcriptional regulator [Saccharopolyspora shandongensis]|uniref:TetR/AcrR family transcriptional regulator n=1 Tax=Saccharopolyspora shandongensis TaxID=418495 RepID=UPI0033DB9DD6